MADYVLTIDSDREDAPVPKSRTTSKYEFEEDGLDPEFYFDASGDPYAEIHAAHANLDDIIKQGAKPAPISVDDIIARRNASKRKRDVDDEESEEQQSDDSEIVADSDQEPDTDKDDEAAAEEESGESQGSDSGDNGSSSLDNDDGDDIYVSGSDEESDVETQAEKERKAAYFASESVPSKTHDSFLTMNLSRPILKAISALGFTQPTPIQTATVPVALLGKDVVGNAITGSGKTAAFMIPMLERLLYREKGKNTAATRCLVLVPTRELAIQCYEVGKKLATHTDIRFSLVVGGLSLKAQEADLRLRPDVVIATPGRLIDHLHNSPSFHLEALDILVLDEADRMLSDGFSDELSEIIKSCPTSRQTLLFSATMTDSVDELVRMSLRKPVRLFVDPKKSTAQGLIQEFVRVRTTKENDRSAMLVALCKRTFRSRVIIFFRSKKLAHQMRIVFGLLGMTCDELHGDLSQEQRLQALRRFRDGSVDFLMATDLASRGLDIKGIETVINYDMPGQLAQYLHRVGRTARAGRKGRSTTLVGEGDRKMLKTAMKHATDADSIRHRIIPNEVVIKWVKKLEELRHEVHAVLQDEKEERQLRNAEMAVKKGENMLQYEEEIYSRPARTWFQTSKDKERSKAISRSQYEAGFTALKEQASKAKGKDNLKRDKTAGLSRKAKRRKAALEEEAGESKAVNAAIRAAKKEARPQKIGVLKTKHESNTRGRPEQQKGAKSAFDLEAGQRRKKRAKAGGSRRR